MNRVAVSAALAMILSAPAAAQDGPSFDCDDASTATEAAICASPELSRLELRMAEAYEDLAARIGRAEARRIADELLVTRQACGADEACIETRLMISMGVFISEGQPELIDQAEPLDLVAAAPPAADPVPEADPNPVMEPAPAEDLVSQVDPFVQADQAAATRDGFEPLDILAAPAAAPAPTPAPAPGAVPASDLGRAFAALAEYRRVNVEGRLRDAGYALAAADGHWGEDTEVAVGAFLADAERRGLGPGHAEDPAAVLAFIDSDAFKRVFLGEAVPLPFEW